VILSLLIANLIKSDRTVLRVGWIHEK